MSNSVASILLFCLKFNYHKPWRFV